MESHLNSMNVLMIQSLVRVWLAARLAEKKIKKHVFRTKIAHELLATENSYERDLRTVHQEFELQSTSVLTTEERLILFMNTNEISLIHTALAKGLQDKISKWSYHQTIADVILAQVENFRVYKEYITNYKEATAYLQKNRSAKLEKFLEKRESNTFCRNLKLEGFLVMPIQRLPRYLLLLKELRKYTDNTHPDYALIAQAIEALDAMVKTFNELQRAKETSEKISEIRVSVLGISPMVTMESMYIFEGPLHFDKSKKQLSGVMKSLSVGKDSSQSEWKDIFVYLFKDLMLCAKKLGATSSLIGALHGKGFYKFSTAKAIEISAEMQLHINSNNATSFKLVDKYGAHEFLTATPQIRNQWVVALGKTVIKETKTVDWDAS